MPDSKRVFILGAGFSQPAGMPLATELLPLLITKLQLEDMREWLEGMRDRLAWLSGNHQEPGTFAVNIEQFFHYAHFDVEVHRLRQHLARVGRADGPGTPWNQAKAINTWLSYLERALRDVILERDQRADLSPIDRWARIVTGADAVLTFNYDRLVEHSLSGLGQTWNHGTGREGDQGVPVFKLHGSIDWIVADRSESFSRLDLLFDKGNENRSEMRTGHVEDDSRLWRCRTSEQLNDWIDGRDLQSLSTDAQPRAVGIAGLGAYKELHQIPGLGLVWSKAMRSLYEADVAVIIGFSLSDFDAMAQMQFAEVARARSGEQRPLRTIVIDPFATGAAKERFRRVFHCVDFVEQKHEQLDWSKLR